MNLPRSPVAFQVRSQYHRGSKSQPSKIRSLHRSQLHISVLTHNNRRFIDRTILETTVASQNKRTAHNGLCLVPFHQTGTQIELNSDPVALFPLTVHRQVSTLQDTGLRSPIYGNCRNLAPCRDTQGNGESCLFRRIDLYLDLISPRIFGRLPQPDRLLARQH